ncbi:MAG: biopolymer transporter ExbD [Pseudomonadota bacterium]|nr:biopolymer transporter ExbD [Pseudomonadota bacterium]
MKFGGEHGEEEVGINLTPLIDVVFLLLIFFMVTTTFTRQARIELKLPEAASAEQQPQPESLSIEISADGEYAVRGPGEQAARVLINSRGETLRRAIKLAGGGAEELSIVISADRNTSHESVIRALDAARREGYTRIAFATRMGDPE